MGWKRCRIIKTKANKQQRRKKDAPPAKRQKRDEATSTTSSSLSKASATSTVSSSDEMEILDLHRECVKELCIALNSGDPDEHEKAFNEYTTENMMFYGKWMNEENLPTDYIIKELIIRDRKTFLSFWESRMTAIPDLLIKFHFPVKFQLRDDGGITAYINMLVSGTKLCESKSVFYSETLDSNIVSMTMDKDKARPHPHDMMAAKANTDAKRDVFSAAAADAVAMIQAGYSDATAAVENDADTNKNRLLVVKDGKSSSSDDALRGGIHTGSSFPSSQNQKRSSVFDDTYRMARTMSADSYGTLSFHFDKTTNKVFEIDMLRSVVRK